jgi:hypothetical protein
MSRQIDVLDGRIVSDSARNAPSRLDPEPRFERSEACREDPES